MMEKRLYSGNELNIMLRVLCCICMMMVQKTASSPCRAHICLNWKIEDTRLVLICKVDALNFPITFYDPFNDETGFCVPHEQCISLLHKASITKNNTQHEIIVKIPLNMQLNGWWTCKYGDNNERAVTEVTIQYVPLKTVKIIDAIPHLTKCWTLMLLWCMFGFGCSFLLVRLIIFVYTHRCFWESDKHKSETNGYCSSCGRCSHAAAVKKVILSSLTVSLFVLPVLIGHFEEKLCSTPQVFVIYGAIVGIISCMLLTIRASDHCHSYTVVKQTDKPESIDKGLNNGLQSSFKNSSQLDVSNYRNTQATLNLINIKYPRSMFLAVKDQSASADQGLKNCSNSDVNETSSLKVPTVDEQDLPAGICPNTPAN